VEELEKDDKTINKRICNPANKAFKSMPYGFAYYYDDGYYYYPYYY